MNLSKAIIIAVLLLISLSLFSTFGGHDKGQFRNRPRPMPQTAPYQKGHAAMLDHLPFFRRRR